MTGEPGYYTIEDIQALQKIYIPPIIHIFIARDKNGHFIVACQKFHRTCLNQNTTVKLS